MERERERRLAGARNDARLGLAAFAVYDTLVRFVKKLQFWELKSRSSKQGVALRWIAQYCESQGKKDHCHLNGRNGASCLPDSVSSTKPHMSYF